MVNENEFDESELELETGNSGEQYSQPENVLADRVRSLGRFVPPEMNDDELLREISNLYDAQPDPEEFDAFRSSREQFAQYEKDREQFEQWRQQQSQQQQPEPPTRDPFDIEPDPNLLELVEQDASGRYKPKEKYAGAAVEAAKHLNEQRLEVQDRIRKIVDNPFDVVRTGGLEEYFAEREKKIREEILQEIDQRNAATQADNEINQFFMENEGLFEVNEQGVPLIDPRTRRWVPTARYVEYDRLREEAAHEYNITDPLKLHRYAVKHLSEVKQDNATEQPRRKFLDRMSERHAARQTNRGNTVAAAAAMQDAQNDGVTDFKAIAEQEAKIMEIS